MLDALNTFLAVVESGNFSRAALAQGVVVSSIARKIDVLEAELGARLFNRGTRRMQLTDAGDKLLPRARAVLAELADLRGELASLHAEPRGVLSVTAPATFGRRHVMPALSAFLKRHPRMEVDLHLSDEMVDLAVRRIDVAIRIGVLPDSDLLATRLAPQQRVACASPEYLRRNGSPNSPAELMQHDCLTVLDSPRRAGWWTFDGVNANKALGIRGRLRTDDSDALMQAALDGVGIAHLATWLVSDEVAAGRLIVLFGAAEPERSASAIHAVRVAGRSPAKASLFIDHLRHHIGMHTPYWERAFSEAAQKTPPYLP